MLSLSKQRSYARIVAAGYSLKVLLSMSNNGYLIIFILVQMSLYVDISTKQLLMNQQILHRFIRSSKNPKEGLFPGNRKAMICIYVSIIGTLHPLSKLIWSLRDMSYSSIQLHEPSYLIFTILSTFNIYDLIQSVPCFIPPVTH